MDLRDGRPYYNGNTFYKHDGELEDAAFRKMYHHFESAVLDTNDVKDIERCFKAYRDTHQPDRVVMESVVESAGMAHEYLLICCPTVLGFSFENYSWGKIPSL